MLSALLQSLTRPLPRARAQGDPSAFARAGAASAADGAAEGLSAYLASLSLAEPVMATPAAERRGHAGARGAATPVTPFSDADDAPTPPPPQQPAAASPAGTGAFTPSPGARSPVLSPQQAASAAAFGERVARLRGALASHALLLHCPACAGAVGTPDFAECLALTCSCGAKFCGWCLSACAEASHHDHVAACASGSGLFASRPAFDAAHRPRRAALAAAFVEAHTALPPWTHRAGSASPAVDVVLRMALLAAAADELAAYGIALFETADGRVSYRFLPDPNAVSPASSPFGRQQPRDGQFPGFEGFHVRADDEQNGGGPGDAAQRGGAPGGCAAAAWERLAGPRTPLARIDNVDANVMRGMAPPVLQQQGVVVRGREGDAPLTPAPATPDGPGAARAAHAAAAARRREPPPRRSPLSMLR
jgi:hypothetical protein